MNRLVVLGWAAALVMVASMVEPWSAQERRDATLVELTLDGRLPQWRHEFALAIAGPDAQSLMDPERIASMATGWDLPLPPRARKPLPYDRDLLADRLPSLDADRNGSIDRDEFQSELALLRTDRERVDVMFQAIDTDRDLMASPAELAAPPLAASGGKGMPAGLADHENAMLGRLDSSGDGILTLREGAAELARFFVRFDRDGNGVVDEYERTERRPTVDYLTQYLQVGPPEFHHRPVSEPLAPFPRDAPFPLGLEQ